LLGTQIYKAVGVTQYPYQGRLRTGFWFGGFAGSFYNYAAQ